MISAKSFNDFAEASDSIKAAKGAVHSGEGVSKHMHQMALIIALILQCSFISSYSPSCFAETTRQCKYDRLQKLVDLVMLCLWCDVQDLLISMLMNIVNKCCIWSPTWPLFCRCIVGQICAKCSQLLFYGFFNSFFKIASGTSHLSSNAEANSPN